jgi:hypothetical protein
MAKTETAIQAQQLTKLYRGDRLAVERFGFLRLHAACRPRRARLRTVRPRQAMSSIG